MVPVKEDAAEGSEEKAEKAEEEVVEKETKAVEPESAEGEEKMDTTEEVKGDGEAGERRVGDVGGESVEDKEKEQIEA